MNFCGVFINDFNEKDGDTEKTTTQEMEKCWLWDRVQSEDKGGLRTGC